MKSKKEFKAKNEAVVAKTEEEEQSKRGIVGKKEKKIRKCL